MAKSKKVVKLRVGDEHAIHLESLLPAGYEWEPEVQGDEQVAEVTKSASGEEGGEEAVGVGPDEVVTIKAVRPGKATIRLAQRRPWEHGTEPHNEEVVELQVEE
jgi:predicted secreted protein